MNNSDIDLLFFYPEGYDCDCGICSFCSPTKNQRLDQIKNKIISESYAAFKGIMNTPFDIDGYPTAKEAASGMNAKGVEMLDRIDDLLSSIKE